VGGVTGGTQSEGRPLPLTGLRVLDLGRIYQGPWCGTLLALAGATVVKIEAPGGEPARGPAGSTSVPFALVNSNKYAVTLDRKAPRGRELFLDLVRGADVVVENFGPGVMERLGLGPERLLAENPRLVYGGATAYGTEGPDRDKLGMDVTLQAYSGVMSVTGHEGTPPVKAGVAFVDFLGAANLYAGIVTALYERERTGRGRIVEIAMIDTIYPTLASNLASYYRDGTTPQTGNGHGGAALVPYNVYPTSDGHVALIVLTPRHWRGLCEAMGRPELADDERFRSNGRRYHNVDALEAEIVAWTTAHPRDGVVAALEAARVPAAAVRRVPELVEDPHLHQRGAVRRIDHPDIGEMVVPHSPLRFRGSDPVPLSPSPAIGEHNRLIYGEWLGLDAEEIDRLAGDGVL
jgi:crotonobetainyl-CoA:carnitine CoA-transferase CaiB-like acyl-CoA transferase